MRGSAPADLVERIVQPDSDEIEREAEPNFRDVRNHQDGAEEGEADERDDQQLRQVERKLRVDNLATLHIALRATVEHLPNPRHLWCRYIDPPLVSPLDNNPMDLRIDDDDARQNSVDGPRHSPPNSQNTPVSGARRASPRNCA